MDILVFGAGSLGSLLGGLLAREHAVTLVGREPHVAAVRESGLRVTGAFDRHIQPDALTDLPAGFDADLALVTVKAYDTPAAADALAGGEFEAVLSLQNGMGNEATLADRLDYSVLAGTTTYGAKLVEPGVVECTGVGDVTLGPHADAPRDLAEQVGDVFLAAGIETAVVNDMTPRLWRKLAINAAINPVTALAGVENGALLEEPPRETAERAAVEVACVAREHGIDFEDEAAREAVREVADATAANVSSMRADLENGRRTEIDAINGYVIEHADRAVPVNETLASLVRTRERAHGVREG